MRLTHAEHDIRRLGPLGVCAQTCTPVPVVCSRWCIILHSKHDNCHNASRRCWKGSWATAVGFGEGSESAGAGNRSRQAQVSCREELITLLANTGVYATEGPNTVTVQAVGQDRVHEFLLKRWGCQAMAKEIDVEVGEPIRTLFGRK
jgi:hypothetical protein